MQIDGRLDITITAIPSKEYHINPHAESAHEVYTSDGKQLIMSEEAYELYKHQLNLYYKMNRRIYDMKFKDKMKSFVCIEHRLVFLTERTLWEMLRMNITQWRGLNELGDSLC